MAWGSWMVVQLSVEEELKLERSVRELQNQITDEKVGRLCGSLLKQSYFYQQLVRQAVHHIATLEMEQELSSRPKRFRQRLIGAFRVLFRKTPGVTPKVVGSTLKDLP